MTPTAHKQDFTELRGQGGNNQLKKRRATTVSTGFVHRDIAKAHNVLACFLSLGPETLSRRTRCGCLDQDSSAHVNTEEPLAHKQNRVAPVEQ